MIVLAAYLAKKVPEIDLIISGHSHTNLEKPIQHGNTFVVSCGSFSHNVGSLSMKQKADGRWEMARYDILPVENVVPDAEVNGFVLVEPAIAYAKDNQVDVAFLDIEMDTILAVAIGGNSLGGGRFKISGSIIGAYVIQMLTITLYAMKVSSTDVKAYKAIVIVLLVVIGSPVVKEKFSKLVGPNMYRHKKAVVKGGEE